MLWSETQVCLRHAKLASLPFGITYYTSYFMVSINRNSLFRWWLVGFEGLISCMAEPQGDTGPSASSMGKRIARTIEAGKYVIDHYNWPVHGFSTSVTYLD